MSENCNDIEKPTEKSDTEANTNNSGDVAEVPLLTDPLSTYPKHPLQHTWTFWFFDSSISKDWSRNHREVTSFSTVEDFWSIYMHLKPASELRQGCDYSLFKQGIRPMWEDRQNKAGGRWLLSLDRKQRQDLDKYWLETVLSLIGETIDPQNEICGAVVNYRSRGDKISIWTSDCSHKNALMELGKLMKERLHISPKTPLLYQSHSDSSGNNSSSVKHLYIL